MPVLRKCCAAAHPRIHSEAQHPYLGVETGSLKLPDSCLNASAKMCMLPTADGDRQPSVVRSRRRP